MARGPVKWHVWHWNGEAFDLVWHDLPKGEAENLATWRNIRAGETGTQFPYVIAGDGYDPVLP